MNTNRRLAFGILFLTLAGGVSIIATHTLAEETSPKTASKDPAIERARREVRMLDDIYKTAIVLVTEHYVKEDSDLPAGSAFKALFEAVEKKGWHTVRLVDASGGPVNDENVAKDGFEKKAIREILAGKASYDEVIVEGEKKFLWPRLRFLSLWRSASCVTKTTAMSKRAKPSAR